MNLLVDTHCWLWLVADPGAACFDRGHCGDVDLTQIEQTLRLTPTERLRRHEAWRLFVKEALALAEARRR